MIACDRALRTDRRVIVRVQKQSLPTKNGCGAVIRNARTITKITGQGCRTSLSAVMAPYCRLRADAVRCNLTSAIPFPPR